MVLLFFSIEGNKFLKMGNVDLTLADSEASYTLLEKLEVKKRDSQIDFIPTVPVVKMSKAKSIQLKKPRIVLEKHKVKIVEL